MILIMMKELVHRVEGIVVARIFMPSDFKKRDHIMSDKSNAFGLVEVQS